MTSDRERLRATFDKAAESYQQARPEYPAELLDELVRLAGLRPGDRLLEIGCATGKATLPLARRGFAITCLEIGAELAAAAQRNLAGFPQGSTHSPGTSPWAIGSVTASTARSGGGSPSAQMAASAATGARSCT